MIRPLAYCKEEDIGQYAVWRNFPIIPCKLCGSQDNLQRAAIKHMLKAWEREFPGRLESIFNGIRNVAPSHLADLGLFDFVGLGGSNYTGEQGSRPSWLLSGEDKLAGALE